MNQIHEKFQIFFFESPRETIASSVNGVVDSKQGNLK